MVDRIAALGAPDAPVVADASSGGSVAPLPSLAQYSRHPSSIASALALVAVRNGWLDRIPITNPNQLVADAAWCGGLDLIRLLVEDRKLVPLRADHATIAAAGGDIATIQWFDAKLGGRWSPQAMDAAAANGHLDAVIFLHERGAACTTHAMDGAAANGHLPIVEFLHEHRTEGCSQDAVVRAAAGGHQHVIEWFHVNMGSIFTDAVMDAALTRGHVGIAEWLHLHRTESCSPTTLLRAVENGQVESIRWMLKNMPRVEWNLKPDNQISGFEKEFPDLAKSAPVADESKSAEAIELVRTLDKDFVIPIRKGVPNVPTPAIKENNDSDDPIDSANAIKSLNAAHPFADSIRNMADLLEQPQSKLNDFVMMHGDTLTRLLHGDLPLPLSVDTLRAALADSFELDRIDIARELLLPVEASRSARNIDGSDESTSSALPALPIRSGVSVPLDMELLLVRSPEMASIVTEAMQPSGIALFTHLDVIRLAAETNAAPASRASNDPRGNHESLLVNLNLAVATGQTARSPELAGIARKVLASLDAAGLVPHAVGYELVGQWITAAAGLGDMERVRMLLPHTGKMPPLRALDAAALHGHLDIVKVLAQECNRHAIAVSTRSPERAPKLLTIDGGIIGGHIECIKAVLALNHKVEPSRAAIASALERNTPAAVWWFLSKNSQTRYLDCFKDLQTIAASTGHIDLLNYAIRNGVGKRAEAEAMNGAAKGGHINAIRSLHTACLIKPAEERDANCSIRGIELAATEGHLDVFEYLWEHADIVSGKTFAGVPPSSIAPAARKGHLNIIESYMSRTQGPIDNVLEAALAGGHLEMARIIVESGRGTLSARSMVDIAKTGSVEAAAWLYERIKDTGASIPNSALLMACRGNHADLTAFLIDECGLAPTEALRNQAERYGARRSAAIISSRL
nr:hypothetical protein HK105_003961 [Polyrhizophydium stewartii]